jgi:hypothetical protein
MTIAVLEGDQKALRAEAQRLRKEYVELDKAASVRWTRAWCGLVLVVMVVVVAVSSAVVGGG